MMSRRKVGGYEWVNTCDDLIAIQQRQADYLRQLLAIAANHETANLLAHMILNVNASLVKLYELRDDYRSGSD